MKKKILLADASATIQKVFKLVIENRYELATANTSEELFALLPEYDPDVLFVDIKLKSKDGYSVSKEAKDLAYGLKVVLLHGIFNDLDEEKVAISNCDKSLVKPFENYMLLNLLKELFLEDKNQTKPVRPEDNNILEDQINQLDELINFVQLNKIKDNDQLPPEEETNFYQEIEFPDKVADPNNEIINMVALHSTEEPARTEPEVLEISDEFKQPEFSEEPSVNNPEPEFVSEFNDNSELILDSLIKNAESENHYQKIAEHILLLKKKDLFKIFDISFPKKN